MRWLVLVLLAFTSCALGIISNKNDAVRQAARDHDCPIDHVVILSDQPEATTETVRMDVCGHVRTYFHPWQPGSARHFSEVE